ncbi:DNA cytosine methyltransferase [Nostoc sp.]|uniref:DNA cytosine methyltransferase n=1 Tax=Nostoc sp. TaxID=1180 RepID=UPI002FF5520F
MKTFTIGSIASGMGMHLHELKQIGGVPVWAIESDAQIAHCYYQNHEGQVLVQKVQDVDPTALTDVDLLIATLSCKNASISNTKRGESPEDTAAGVAVANIIRAKLPQYFMLENVWGYRNFESFKQIESALNECDYYFRYYKFNCRHWGVAQSRDRLYGLAVRGGSFLDPVRPQVEEIGWYEAIADLIDELPETTLAPWQQRKFPELTKEGGRRKGEGGTELTHPSSFFPLPSSLFPHPSSLFPLPSSFLIKRAGGGRDSDRLYQSDEPSFAIRAMGRKADNHSRVADAVVGGKIVAVTPRACLRFFGDKETADKIWLPPTKSLANEVVGNGASWVMFRSLFEHLSVQRSPTESNSFMSGGEMLKVGDRVHILKGKHKDKSAVVYEIKKAYICCRVNDEFYFNFPPEYLEAIENSVTGHHLDFYESPSWFVTELLRHVKLEGVIGEPCVGMGAIASLLQAWTHTQSIWTNDIDPEKAADYHLDATNSESWNLFPECDWICTNPPYAQNAAPIVENAFEKARVGVVAFLLTNFLEPCEDRSDFLSQHPPSLILVLPRYCFRKNKKGDRWATDNTTISCFVWDKRATQQQLIVRPKSEITGFYKNPDCAIGFLEAQKIVKAIASGEINTNYQPMKNVDSPLQDATRWNPDHFGDVPHKADGDQLTIFCDYTHEPPDPDDYPNIPAYLEAWQEWEEIPTRFNTKAGIYIVDQLGTLGIIKEDLGFGFVVDWLGTVANPNPNDKKDITYNWERDEERINTFKIANTPLGDRPTNVPKVVFKNKEQDVMAFQFSGTGAIASQIAQLQEQLNQLTASLKPYQECEQKAEELRSTVAEYGRVMMSKGISQSDISIWGKSLYSSASGLEFIDGDSGAIAAQNEVIAQLKADLERSQKLRHQALSERTEVIALLENAVAERNEALDKIVDITDGSWRVVEKLKTLQERHAQTLEELEELKNLKEQTDPTTIEVLQKENMALIAKIEALDLLTEDMDTQLAESAVLGSPQEEQLSKRAEQQLMPEVEVLKQQVYELRQERDGLVLQQPHTKTEAIANESDVLNIHQASTATNEIHNFQEGDRVKLASTDDESEDLLNRFGTVVGVKDDSVAVLFSATDSEGQCETIIPKCHLVLVNQATPESQAQIKASNFISGVRSKAGMNNVTWTNISEVCQGNLLTLREMILKATTKYQKELVNIDNLSKLMADYVDETGDITDFGWIDDTLKSKVEALMEAKKSFPYHKNDWVRVTESGEIWQVQSFDGEWLLVKQDNKRASLHKSEVGLYPHQLALSA